LKSELWFESESLVNFKVLTGNVRLKQRFKTLLSAYNCVVGLGNCRDVLLILWSVYTKNFRYPDFSKFPLPNRKKIRASRE